MTLNDYFAMPDTAASGSPTGTLMVRILEKDSGIGFDAARTQANVLLDRAAGKKVYRMPRILSAAEEEAQNERLRQRFRPAQEALAA
jgi:hypothetical protein